MEISGFVGPSVDGAVFRELHVDVLVGQGFRARGDTFLQQVGHGGHAPPIDGVGVGRGTTRRNQPAIADVVALVLRHFLHLAAERQNHRRFGQGEHFALDLVDATCAGRVILQRHGCSPGLRALYPVVANG